MQIDLIILTSCHPASNAGYQYILTVKDHFSTFVWLRKLKRKNKNAVFKKLNKIFRDFRAPDILQADNGGEFKNIAMSQRQMAALLKRLKLKPICNQTSPSFSTKYECIFGDGFTTDDLGACFPNTHMIHSRVRASSTNGSVERANQDVQRLLYYMMQRHAEDHPDEADVWIIHLDKVRASSSQVRPTLRVVVTCTTTGTTNHEHDAKEEPWWRQRLGAALQGQANDVTRGHVAANQEETARAAGK
jgi:hypothetical protein